MTKKEANLKEIMESMPETTNEITHVVLKSQFGTKKKSLWMKR